MVACPLIFFLALGAMATDPRAPVVVPDDVKREVTDKVRRREPYPHLLQE
jgi:hypothetical protein